MLKVCVLLALAISGVVGQEAPPQGAPQGGSSEAAAEPYSYGYQTESHSASEQRDPQGRVTGFYTIADADGRERRVEYSADESGFRAKVATNEVGTKSENPADVEIQASEPTPGQFVYQSPPQQQAQYQQAPPAPHQQQVYTQQRYSTVQQQQQPGRQVQYFQQQQQQRPLQGYYQAGYGPGNIAYGTGYGSSYGYGSGYRSGYGGYGATNVGNYNNHTPSQYYRSVTTTSSGVQPGTYSAGGQTVRYVNQPGVVTTGVRTVNYPGGVSYGGGASYGVPAGASSGSQGSSNYLVLQKRSADKKNQ